MLRYRALLERRLAGEPCPITPVLFWKHHPIADQDGGALCRATLEFQDRFDCDLIKISPAATYQLPDYGLRDNWCGDPVGRRAVTATVIRRPDDWSGLPWLDPRQGFVARFGECVRMVRSAAPPEVPVIITVFDPMFQAVTLAGNELIRVHLVEAPDAVAAGLSRITDNTVALISHLIAQGADGIFLASQHATGNCFPHSVFARYGMPGVMACWEAMTGSLFDIVHVHGAGIHDDLFAAIPGATIHYDMWADNPAPARFLDAGCAVATGPSPEMLASHVHDDEVTAACMALLELGGPTILATGCSIPLAVRADQIRLMSALARSACWN
jgi:uroporphyrinogen decarboxylase